ncbi:hypothetical protein CGRA01v4_05543 [Colletotrichum graminicola]|nr:hypothetical protein CGRA01v4_05543 [Colletotrichum graminicola]
MGRPLELELRGVECSESKLGAKLVGGTRWFRHMVSEPVAEGIVSSFLFG